MDTYKSQLSRSSELNEQIAREIFDILGEDGPVLIIMDREGNHHLSDPVRVSELNISDTFLKELCSKIDDGAEPIVTQMNDVGIVAVELATEGTRYGYVVMALPQYNIESTMINFSLVELLLNQIGLIAELIEKTERSYELQMKRLSMYNHSNLASS
jgi:hypothetical protein